MYPTFGLFPLASRARLWCLAALLFANNGYGQSGAGRVSDLESDTDRWLELQSQIAEAENDWTTEKLLLEGSIQILEAEQATLSSGIESNEEASKVYIAHGVFI
jgi:hypothetical protein